MSSLLKVCMDVGHISKPVPGLLHQFVYFLPMALLVYPIFGLYICLIVSNKERSKNSLLAAKKKVPNQNLKNNFRKRAESIKRSNHPQSQILIFQIFLALAGYTPRILR